MPIFRKSFFCILFVSGVLIFSSPAQANNLTITNVSLETRDQGANTAIVEFDIDWENSWRDTENWDAAWVFFKVSKSGGNWVHGKMDASGTNPSDTSYGSGTSLTRYVPSDRAGALLYRSGTGTGDISNNNVRLKLDYGEAPVSAGDDDLIEVLVYGIEMVYIPTATYVLGFGGGEYGQSSYGPFVDACTSGDVDPVTITSSRPYVSSDSDGDGDCGDIGWHDWYGGSRPSSDTAVNANFPWGYYEYYLMKYELSQGQYRDFLNSLPSAYYSNRVASTTNNYYAMTNTTSPSHRNTIKYKSTGGPFVCDLDDDNTGDEANDGEWIAMNFVSVLDCWAFADWAGMRPATEMEYEKACRGSGTSYVVEEPAHESISWSRAKTPINSSGTNTETPSTMPYLINYDGYGSTTDGPLRVGFASTSSTSRTAAVAGYYGNMELSGNVYELYVGLGRSYAYVTYTGSHGDGILTSGSCQPGNATNSDWPLYNNTNCGCDGATKYGGFAARGGSFDGTYHEVLLEDRYRGDYTTETRVFENGCRFARDP